MNGAGAKPAIVLVVAFAENRVIGRDNAIPWRLKSDLQRFKEITLNKPVVMGRKTFVSLRRPLAERTNIVVTRDPNFRAPGAIVATSIASGMAIAHGDALRRFAAEIAIIGGAEIYSQAMQDADRLEVTEVHDSVHGDTYFPAIDPLRWQETARSRHSAGSHDSADFSYVTYRRHRRD